MGSLNNNLPVFSITPKNAQLVLSSPTAYLVATLPANVAANQVLKASASGSRVYGLNASTNETTNTVNLYVYVSDGSNSYPIGFVAVPINSGNTVGNAAGGAAVVSVDLLSFINIPGLPVDNTGKPYIELGANNYLCVAVSNSGLTSKVLVTAQYADYQ
ncbi:MAG TPA: hypothetical protein VNY36_04160 [Bacteroidia bacterium]|jgi:hypothetical protein|nr:hypothetical protein [Bacteroidia bacterium]